MLGTIVNTGAILFGGLLGFMFGHILPDKVKKTVIQGIGMAVLLIGGSMALKTQNTLVVITSLVLGGVVGEVIDIELKLQQFGQWLENMLSKNGHGQGKSFTKAFVTASLVYCVGAMAIMGAFESGLTGNNSILYAKSMLDGVTAIVFTSSMGIGVIASAIPVFLYQGILTISAGALSGVLSTQVINEMGATGGLLILGIGMNILEIKEIKVGNLLPGLFMAIPITVIFAKLHLGM